MGQSYSNNQTPLDGFFDMLDAIEEDISHLVSDENEETTEKGGYECLFISFSNLRLYCESSGIDLEQIEDQYQALRDSPNEHKVGNLKIDEELDTNNEVLNFCKLMEQIENSLSALEKRCENSEEIFDEWTCVFIMYSYLRKYCEKGQVDFENLQQEISNLHSEMEKDEKSPEN